MVYVKYVIREMVQKTCVIRDLTEKRPVIRDRDPPLPPCVKGKSDQMTKVYIALFTFCVTRAVHLELVEDLSIETIKWCLRRFIARRGVPTLMISDNAKTFKGVEKELRLLYNHPQVKEEMQNRRIEWRFNLERLHGGVDFLRG